MFIGIDLGTSNSTLAVFDGETVTVVPNSLGENLTPSVVRVDGHGTVAVGRTAQRLGDSDPASLAREFKRLMGTAETFTFPGGKALLPEQLAGHVLASVLADARDGLGFSPRAAVVSTPALFELPQNHATVKAGKLAGLDEVVLIQEPIVAAIAAGWRQEMEGSWLVFDLGGGTLDVSLLETKDGRLRVVDHAGDNFLGGKDLDHAVVGWAKPSRTWCMCWSRGSAGWPCALHWIAWASTMPPRSRPCGTVAPRPRYGTGPARCSTVTPSAPAGSRMRCTNGWPTRPSRSATCARPWSTARTPASRWRCSGLGCYPRNCMRQLSAQVAKLLLAQSHPSHREQERSPQEVTSFKHFVTHALSDC